MTGHELIEALRELPDELLSQPVVLSVRRSEADQWPRQVHDITIGPLPGEAVPPRLGLSGFSGEFA